MAKSKITPLELPLTLNSHTVANLQLDSRVLKDNPLGDPTLRHNYVLLPKGKAGLRPVIFHLSGYFSTGYNQFTPKTLNRNFVENVDRLVKAKKAPACVHVFVEATTFWGGSQFINSHGCGRYSDYILKELVPAVIEMCEGDPNKIGVMGGSSGGYGALALISEKKSPFKWAFATAPDSFFQASLMTELFHAAPELAKYKNFAAIKKMIDAGEIQDKKSFFTLANVVAMAHCYSPKSAFKNGYLEWPIDLYTGEVNKKIWREWCKNDPIEFLEKRKGNLKGKKIYLDVGKYDNFSLQFGTRQIFSLLKKEKVNCKYSEFPGNHFGLSARRLGFLESL